MILRRMDEFVGGWFVGDFEPTVHKTKDFEVCYKVHEKGEQWDAHYHKGTEINYLIRGKMIIGGQLLVEGDVFILEPYEISDPEFLEKCELIVVKVPSDPEDKYVV
jgi:quercetin dioxygenase-like cupin family protein